jgi:hypothetical protein
VKRPPIWRTRHFIRLPLAHLIRTRQVTSVELTEVYLARLKIQPAPGGVVTYDDLAMQQARRADGDCGRVLQGRTGFWVKTFWQLGYPTTWSHALSDQTIDMMPPVNCWTAGSY